MGRTGEPLNTSSEIHALPWNIYRINISILVLVLQQIGFRYDQANTGTKCGAFNQPNYPTWGGKESRSKLGQFKNPQSWRDWQELLLAGCRIWFIQVLYHRLSVYTSHFFRTCPILNSSNTWSWYPSWQGPQPLNLTVLYYWFPPLAMTGWTPWAPKGPPETASCVFIQPWADCKPSYKSTSPTGFAPQDRQVALEKWQLAWFMVTICNYG